MRRALLSIVLVTVVATAAAASPVPRDRRAVDAPATVQFELDVGRALNAGAQSVAIGDVTGDGRDDLVATSNDYASCGCTLNIIKQLANGSLSNSQIVLPTHSLGYADPSVGMGDLNGDGKLDVAVTVEEGVDVFYQGEGGLQPAVKVNVPDTWGQQVEIGDVNADGLGDMVYLADDVRLLTNTGSGFTRSRIPVAGNEIELADVTGDGLVDLVDAVGRNILVFPNDAVGGFSPFLQYEATSVVGGLAVGDANHDGRADVLVGVGGNSDSRMNAFLQSAAGTLSSRAVYESLDIPDSAEAADLNGDGRDDLVVGHGTWTNIGVYLQRTDGTFAPEKLYPIDYVNIDHKGLAIGDLNGDDQNDIAIADFTGSLTLKIQQAELAIAAPREVTYLADATWTVHLGPYSSTSNPYVRVYATGDGADDLIAEGPVDANGDLTGSIPALQQNTTLQARWDGDAASAAVESTRVVRVSVRTTGTLLRATGAAGKYQLYDPGSTPLYRGRVVPLHTGERLIFFLERHTRSGWNRIGSTTVRIGAEGTATVALSSLRTGTNYRVQAKFKADDDHATDSSPWSYLRLT